MISNLYLYTNTPPHAYGTQASKVAETVRRAYSFNKRKSEKEIEIDGVKIERLHWTKDQGNFPFGEVHGNYIPSELQRMCETFVKRYHALIDNTANKVIEEAMQTS
jgi:hypothetical protein